MPGILLLVGDSVKIVPYFLTEEIDQWKMPVPQQEVSIHFYFGRFRLQNNFDVRPMLLCFLLVSLK